MSDEDWGRLPKIGLYSPLPLATLVSLSKLPFSFGESRPAEGRCVWRRLVLNAPKIQQSLKLLLGFYSVFSVTESPYVSSGGRVVRPLESISVLHDVR